MANSILAAGGIYAIRNKVNGKQYVGSAVNIARRFTDHVKLLNRKDHHSVALQRAWLRYGGDAFELVILEIVRDADMLIRREQHWIVHGCGFGEAGYNMSPTAGSPLGVKHTDEARMNMSLSARKRGSSPAAIEAMRQANLGKKRSPETGDKIRQSKIGKKRPPGCMEKMVETRSAAGWKLSPEHAQKLREANTGRTNSPESIAKQKATKAAKRAALGGPGTGQGWLTVNEIRKQKGLQPVDGGDAIFDPSAVQKGKNENTTATA